MKEHKKIKRIITRIAFLVYIIVLLFLVFGADRMEQSDYHYNLVLFSEIKRFVKYRDVVGYYVFFANVVGNFVVFMPFGFLIPTLTNYKYNVVLISLMSFEFSLLIEIVQLFTKLGSFDVDDLLLNTLGGFSGYILYRLCRYIYDSYHKGGSNEEKE